jgi:ABC-type Fe3+-siderophore transport system permease subunit
MLRNNYPITRLIGASIIGAGVMLFFVFYDNLMREIEGGYFVFGTEWQVSFAGVSTIFVIGVGLIFRQKWARILLVVFLAIFILGLFWIITSNLSWQNVNARILGIIVFGVTFATSLTALLYNKKLNDEFDEKVVEELDDTLDSQLFRESDSIS